MGYTTFSSIFASATHLGDNDEILYVFKSVASSTAKLPRDMFSYRVHQLVEKLPLGVKWVKRLWCCCGQEL